MPIRYLSRGDIRRNLIPMFTPEGQYFLETPTATSVSAVTYGEHLDQWESDHWLRGEIRGTDSVTGSVVTKRVQRFVSATGVITPVTPWTNPLDADEPIELLAHGINFQMFDRAIEEANEELSQLVMVPVIDESLLWEWGRTEYPTPQDWSHVETVEVDAFRLGGDYFCGHTELGLSEVALTASTQQAGQCVLIQAYEYPLQEIWFLLRKVGSPTGTLTFQARESASGKPLGGAPGLVATSATYDVEALGAGFTAVGLTLSTLPRFAAETVFQITINPTAATLSASNYVAVRSTTIDGYYGGNASSSADSGATWTAQPGYRLHFRVRDDRTLFQPVHGRFHGPVLATTRQMKLTLPADRQPLDYAVIRLTGLRAPAALTEDIDTCEIDPNAIQDLAYALLIEKFMAGDKSMKTQAEYYRAKALAKAQQARTVPQGWALETGALTFRT